MNRYTSELLEAEAMTFAEKQRVRTAAFLALRLYPVAVGTVLRRELLAWEEFGYRLGPASVVSELIDHLIELAEKSG